MRIIGNDPSTPRQAQIVASGTLSTGDAVIVNADGTVSVVSEPITTSLSSGTPVVFEAASTYYTACGYDANAQKIVIAYRDDGNSSRGTAVVGTVSGTSISFGTPVVFETGAAYPESVVYDSNSQKVVITYPDYGNSGYGTAVVGTVSGASISFGTPVVFESANTTGPRAVFDSSAQKIVIAYTDGGNSSYGTAIVGTVSGTSISFGSPTVYETANSYFKSIAYDANASKVVIAYADLGNSTYGTAIVGTVSGTSISFGTAAIFNGSGSSYYSSIAYDANAQKVVVFYQDGSNSNYGTANVGTVSGTSISFGAKVVFSSSNMQVPAATYAPNSQQTVVVFKDSGDSNKGKVAAGTISGTSISFSSPLTFQDSSSDFFGVAYDASTERVVASYNDSGNSIYGTSCVILTRTAVTNLTTENYIGTAATGAPSGKGAKINLKGAVDENQSGLTAGQSYYVQTDGTLGTTPADPSVFAGTAVAATKLIVKG